MIALRLATEGYWGGDIEKILKAPADLVLEVFQYVAFKADHEAAYIELNREKR